MASCASCTEKFGDVVDGAISSFFGRIGHWVGRQPRKTILFSIMLTLLCGIGFAFWTTEGRPEELWVPQNTVAEQETAAYLALFPPTARINTMIVQAAAAATAATDSNVLTKEHLQAAMRLHDQIATNTSTVDGESYTLTDLCTPGFSCASPSAANSSVCQCFIVSILRQWNYNLQTLQDDDYFMTTLQQYGSKSDLEAVLGNSVWTKNENNTDVLVSAEAFTLSYFLLDRSYVEDGNKIDPINEAWEKDVYLNTLETTTPNAFIEVDYFATRSFGDVLEDDMSGDLILVNISYIVAFLFLGATMGNIKCGTTGSRWTLALGSLFTVGLSTAAGFGVSALCGLFFGPVHAILPFVLLGIGVDDAFVIVNAFNRERTVSRKSENNTALAKRSRSALARAGASITVTSLTDLVAFAISASSALPALASFCAYAAISIFFLWFFSATFFTATVVLDERRQRDNRLECFCCIKGKSKNKEISDDDDDDDQGFQEGYASRYFRNYHAPAILSIPGKVIVLLGFAAMLGYGVYGAVNLSVEDSSRAFIPADTYVSEYLSAADEYFPEQGADLFITFQGSSEIYADRQALSQLKTRVTGLSTAPPYISEPVSEQAYRNVMNGFSTYLTEYGTDAIGGATLGDDNWPTTQEDFVSTLAQYANVSGPGAMYAQDVAFSDDGTQLEAFRVNLEYVKLVKVDASTGEIMDDADKLIDAMDSTRDMVDSWTDLPPAFPFSDKFIEVEGFKIIRKELFLNVGLAIVAVGIIVLVTVASPMTAFLITLNVAFCIVEILGFMYAAGIAIDSVSVINIVLAVGLSVDYSAHIGHCFMVKGGTDKNRRATESLADIGASVVQGATSTFLAVAVLLFSTSYVFQTLSKQFALTVALGIAHGLLLLPVLLSLMGPKPFSSAEVIDESDGGDDVNVKASKTIEETAHQGPESSDDEEENVSSDDKEEKAILPVGWAAIIDPASLQEYYYNSDTGETSWDPPEAKL